jgi:uncharacterized membrane protein
MTDLLVALSTWLHALATIIMVGYFVFAGQIYLPVLETQVKGNALRGLLEQISTRLKPYFGGSLLIFLVTGTHLMLINESYMGLGKIFANLWCVLIVIKHVMVVAFLALATLSERKFLVRISDQDPKAVKQFRNALNINMLLGVAILLLTAIAQGG